MLSSNVRFSTELIINDVIVDAIDQVTMRGLETIASVLGSPFSMSAAWMPYIALGSGEVAPSSEDRFLEAETVRKIGIVSVYGTNAYQVVTSFLAGEPASAFILREVGILDALEGGNLGARWSTDQEYSKGVADEFNITCRIYIA